MKTKLNLILILAGLCASAFLSGCVSTNAAANLAIASAQVTGGSFYATSKLEAVNGSPAGTAAQKQVVADLTLLGTDLNLFATGKLSDQANGALQQTLNQDKLALASNQKAVDDITQILNLLSQTAVGATPAGVTLPSTALLAQTIGNIVTGVNKSVAFFEGKWSVSNPTIWPAAAAAAPATP